MIDASASRLTLVASALLVAVALAAAGQTFTGEGTVYGGNALGGTCGFSKSWKTWTTASMGLTAALNLPQWNSSLNCGRCVAVRHGSNPAVAVQIVDQCPECKHGDLDFAPDAYTAVTKKTPGREQISWSFVDCPDTFVAGNLEFVMKEGSNNYWAAFQPQNFKRGIGQVEISLSSNGQGWQTLARQESSLVGLFFLYQDVIHDSFQLRATFIDGDQTIASPVFESIGSSMSCEQQFTGTTAVTNTDASNSQPLVQVQTVSSDANNTTSGAASTGEAPTSASTLVDDTPISATPSPYEQVTLTTDSSSNGSATQTTTDAATSALPTETPVSLSPAPTATENDAVDTPLANFAAQAVQIATPSPTESPRVDRVEEEETTDSQYSELPVSADLAPAPARSHKACES